MMSCSMKGLLALLLGVSCTVGGVPLSAAPLPSVEERALHLDWRDLQVSPSQNFYTYANGAWQTHHPIPPQYASWGIFSVLHEEVQKRLHQLMIDASHDHTAKPGSVTQKVGDFYISGMNEQLINQQGVTPLAEVFAHIDSIRNKDELQAVIAQLHYIGVDVFFNFGSMQDFENSEQVIGAAQQGGLGLPDRDYYLKQDARFKTIRAAYLNYIRQAFMLLGVSSTVAKQNAEIIMCIETALAKASMSQVQQRDPHAIYHMMNLSELKENTPNFSWPDYFQRMGLHHLTRINLGMPPFFRKMDELLHTVSLNDWKIYLRWHVMDDFSPYLSQPFVEQHFQMVSALTGTKKLLPRWQRIVDIENASLGFAIGQLYVEHYFSQNDKQQVLGILNRIRQVLRNDLQTLPWMAPATRDAALKKLDLMGVRVGYPSRWWDYSSLKIDRGPFVLNMMRVHEFLTQRDLHKIGKPVDKQEWAMTPQTINAYYDPSMNNINIPAGILQPPFFDPNAPEAINDGSIGFVIGHEMTHGFDDQGAQFDAYGNLKNWWTVEDLKQFKAATQCIQKQFSTYRVEENVPVQGQLVMGEATADLGGVTLAFRAFRESDAYKQAKTIHGLTPEQQFFLGVAHVWAVNVRPEQARNWVMVDPHPPAMYRVNGTLANMPEFKSAFGIQPGLMIREPICKIW